MANVRSKKVNGQLVYWDTHSRRWVDAVGPDVYKIIEHFERYVAGDWTVTSVGGGTAALTDAIGGALLLTNGGGDDNEIELQRKGESFKLVGGKPCYFGARWKVSDATQSEVFIGLAITDTTCITAVAEDVSFRKDDGDTNIDCYAETGSTETATAAVGTLANDTYVTTEWYFDGTVVYFYLNGTLVATHTTNIPQTEELTVTFAVMNGEAVSKTMTVDWIRAIQINA